MFRRDFPTTRDTQGNYFIDLDGTLFRYVLNFLLMSELTVPVMELSSTRKLSMYSNPVAVIITQLTITTKVDALLEGICKNFTKWNKHMMDTRDFQVSFTFGPCDYHQEVSITVHLMDYIMKQGFTIRNT
ncbi:unnamed protein product [Coregonus sp. 'balchen']|nr:unnamed protein product [Coregonus sp. 'balchen']